MLQQTRKRFSGPTVKLEVAKKRGSEGKVSDVLAEWVRPLFLHNGHHRLVHCSPQLL